MPSPKAVQCRILAPLLAGHLPAGFSREQLELMVPYFVVDLGYATGFPRSLLFEARKDLGDRIVDSRGRRQAGN